METKFILATLAVVVLVSGGGGLGLGWLWWGSSTGVEYVDSDADERLGDARADAVGDTDIAGTDLGDAIDTASESGRAVAEATKIVTGEYRELKHVSGDVADGLEGDAELAGRLADIVGEGAYRVERGEVDIGGAAGHREGTAEQRGGEGDEAGGE